MNDGGIAKCAQFRYACYFRTGCDAPRLNLSPADCLFRICSTYLLGDLHGYGYASQNQRATLRRPANPKAKTKAPNAIALLRQDHKDVQELANV